MKLLRPAREIATASSRTRRGRSCARGCASRRRISSVFLASSAAQRLSRYASIAKPRRNESYLRYTLQLIHLKGNSFQSFHCTPHPFSRTSACPALYPAGSAVVSLVHIGIVVPDALVLPFSIRPLARQARPTQGPSGNSLYAGVYPAAARTCAEARLT